MFNSFHLPGRAINIQQGMGFNMYPGMGLNIAFTVVRPGMLLSSSSSWDATKIRKQKIDKFWNRGIPFSTLSGTPLYCYYTLIHFPKSPMLLTLLQYLLKSIGSDFKLILAKPAHNSFIFHLGIVCQVNKAKLLISLLSCFKSEGVSASQIDIKVRLGFNTICHELEPYPLKLFWGRSAEELTIRSIAHKNKVQINLASKSTPHNLETSETWKTPTTTLSQPQDTKTPSTDKKVNKFGELELLDNLAKPEPKYIEEEYMDLALDGYFCDNEYYSDEESEDYYESEDHDLNPRSRGQRVAREIVEEVLAESRRVEESRRDKINQILTERGRVEDPRRHEERSLAREIIDEILAARRRVEGTYIPGTMGEWEAIGDDWDCARYFREKYGR